MTSAPTTTSTNIMSDIAANKNVKLLSNKNNTDIDIDDRQNVKKNSTNNADHSQGDSLTSPNSKPDKEDSECINTTPNGELNKTRPDKEEHDSEIIDETNVTDTENIKSTQQDVNPVVNSLSNLKYLSHLTVKPVHQNNSLSSEIKANRESDLNTDEKSLAKSESESRIESVNNEISSLKPKAIGEKDPTLDALKILSKNITIKSLSTKRSIQDNESEDEKFEDAVTQDTTSNIKMKGESNNTSIKKIKVEISEPPHESKIINTISKAIKNAQPTKTINKTNTSATTDSGQSSPAKSTTDILKRFPNITTKPLNVKKNIPPKLIKEENTSIKNEEIKQHEEEIIEISDIDDSDNETETNTKPPEVKQNIVKPENPLKNLSKHITVKSLTQPTQTVLKNVKVEQTDDEDAGQMCNSDEDLPTDVKVCSQKISSRNMTFRNALKNLGKNITVKSRTSSPSQSVKSQDNDSQDDGGVNDASDSDSDMGKVKITEIDNKIVNNNDELEHTGHSDEEHSDNNPIVESPHDSCSASDEENEKDFESEIKASTVQKINREIATDKNTICLNNLKNISKSITIKSLNSNQGDQQEKSKPTQLQESLEVMKNQTKQLGTNLKQAVKELPENISTNRNLKKIAKVVDHCSNESLNQKVSVNKEVTVKTFQTKTVIQEITTTVTKTIKTVNQTVKQETRNSSQVSMPVLPQKVQGMRPSTSKNLQGVVIRHAVPVTSQPNRLVAPMRPAGTVVRPSKQIVSIRPGLNITRNTTPRKHNTKNNLPKSSPNKQVLGKPLKISPSAVTSNKVKRANTEEVSGPFSCFKKPKESLIPVSDVPAFGTESGDSTLQINMASHTTSSNCMSTSKVVKGNSVVTATQMKSEVTSMQQLSRVGNTAVGIKVKCAQVKQTQVQENSESSAMKRTTLEAIERLQKQGLLVKKPRIDADENSESADHADDNVGYSSTEEHDQ